MLTRLVYRLIYLDHSMQIWTKIHIHILVIHWLSHHSCILLQLQLSFLVPIFVQIILRIAIILWLVWLYLRNQMFNLLILQLHILTLYMILFLHSNTNFPLLLRIHGAICLSLIELWIYMELNVKHCRLVYLLLLHTWHKQMLSLSF